MIDGPEGRVLVVEDEPVVAMMLEDMLADLGYSVLGPASTIDEATELAHGGDFDVALLDVNLDGAPSFPVADYLRSRGVPFVFATGYGTRGLADRYSTAIALNKPFSPEALREALVRAQDDGRVN